MPRLIFGARFIYICYFTLMDSIDAAQAYDIITRKDAAFDGLLFFGVQSTGIFCRPICPAKTPKPENCNFFKSAQQALAAGFRACKRCHPSALPGETGPLVKRLIALIETDTSRRWSETDLKVRGIDPSTARRNFKARFGLTFAQYARQRRLGLTAQKPASVIQAQINAGYESASGFRAAHHAVFGSAPNTQASPLFIEWLDTPLGPMIAICDDHNLYLLEFTVRKKLKRQVTRLSTTYRRPIIAGRTAITQSIEDDLRAYFKGRDMVFKTPLILTGTDFQKTVWRALCDIPYGQTRSYGQLAKTIGNAKAFRAVATSNASNGLALIVPCHRVINTGGGLGGYAGGLSKKQWLLDLETGQITP